MRLHRAERDYYNVGIETDPPLVGTWQASFDDRETWVDGTLGAEGWHWLIAGPDFDAAAEGMDPDDTQATITADVVIPWLKVKDDPVDNIEVGPVIELWDEVV